MIDVSSKRPLVEADDIFYLELTQLYEYTEFLLNCGHYQNVGTYTELHLCGCTFSISKVSVSQEGIYKIS